MRGFLFVFFGLLISCRQIPPVPSLTDLVGDNRVEKISCPFELEYADGPAWGPDQSLYFSDVAAGRIYRYAPASGFSLVCKAVKGVNGLIFDQQGMLIICQGLHGQIVRYQPKTGIVDTLAAGYQGRRFNGPNDLVRDRQGGLYFTDPAFSGNLEYQTSEAVYYITPEKKIQAMVNDIPPDGIALSADEKTLYLTDKVNPYIWAFDVMEQGTLYNRRILYHLKAYSKDNIAECAAGMTVDEDGNLFVCALSGIHVIDPHGRQLGIIAVPDYPSNCSFGGDHIDILYITAGNSIYRLKTNTKGKVLYFKSL